MDQKLKKEKTERAKSRITRERVKKKKRKRNQITAPRLYTGEKTSDIPGPPSRPTDQWCREQSPGHLQSVLSGSYDPQQGPVSLSLSCWRTSRPSTNCTFCLGNPGTKVKTQKAAADSVSLIMEQRSKHRRLQRVLSR